MKICVITSTRADFGLLKNLIIELKKNNKFKTKVVASGSHLSKYFGYTYREIEKSGIKISKKIKCNFVNDDAIGISQVMSTCIMQTSKILKNLSPDLMIILGDRYEILASAIAAHLSRIPIAHLHGGEATEGVVDEALRHSITKMSHIHFVAAQEYKKKVVQLGENPNTVFNVGGLGVDNIKCLKFLSKNELEKDLNFRFAKKNILISFHPETLNKFSSKRQFNEVLIALKKFNNINLIFTMPNADLDGRIIFKMLKNFVRKNKNACYFTSMGQLHFLSCLKYVDGMIGNSSSGILEMPSFKKGTIDIGDRQLGRLKAKSVISVKPNRNEIIKGIHTLYSKKFQTKIKTTKSPYGEGGANKKIIKILKKIKLKNILKKKFYSLNVRCA